MERDVAAHEVSEDDGAVRRHPEPDDGVLPARDAAACLVDGERPARPRVARRLPRGNRGLALGLEALGGTEAVVRAASVDERGGVQAVQVKPLRLPVGTMRPADVRALIPLQAEPSEILENRRLRLARGPLDVGVFDAQDERSAGSARHQPVEQGRARIADVEMAGGAWGEADSHRFSWQLTAGS